MTPLLARSIRLLIVLVAVTLAVGALVAADQGSHSVSDTLISASPLVMLIALTSAAALLLIERRVRRDRR